MLQQSYFNSKFKKIKAIQIVGAVSMAILSKLLTLPYLHFNSYKKSRESID
jgi:hypothetical protein